MLTAERLRELLQYDPQTGVFTRLTNMYRWKAGQIAGSVHKYDGYMRVVIDGRQHLAHRLAWFYVTGEWPKDEIDHIDGDKTNNRFSNFREANHAINLQNQKRAHSQTKSGLLGAYKQGSRWRSTILVNGVPRFLGTFSTAEEAHAAYLAAKRIHHPGNML